MSTKLIPPPIDSAREESNRSMRSEMFNVMLLISIFRTAWGKGNDREIQLAFEDLCDWQEAVDDRLTRENLDRAA